MSIDIEFTWLCLRTHVKWSNKPRDSTRVLKALPGKLDIKRHSPRILFFIAYVQKSPLYAHDDVHVSSGARRLTFGLILTTSFLFMGAMKNLADLRVCASSSQPLLPNNAISTKIVCADWFYFK